MRATTRRNLVREPGATTGGERTALSEARGRVGDELRLHSDHRFRRDEQRVHAGGLGSSSVLVEEPWLFVLKEDAAARRSDAGAVGWQSCRY